MDDMIKITGLWKKKTKDGFDFFSGSLGGARIFIFQNNYKTEENHPDYNLYLAPKKKADAAQAEEEVAF